MAEGINEDASRAEITAVFENAAKYLGSIIGQLETDQLLYFYARYKQAKEGPCRIPRPGFFDFQGKQKWDAWNALGDLDPLVAMEQYINTMSEIDPEWELKADDPKLKSRISGMGVAVSTMQGEDDLPDAQKTIFDWCKEGNLQKTQTLLHNGDVNQKDDEGLTLLHWACDRGLDEMVRVLLNNKADVNSQDNEGQTPLHYAAACEHVAVAETLLACGADIHIKDEDGLTPSEAADSSAMVKLLQGT